MPSLRRTLDVALGSLGLAVLGVPILAMMAIARLESGKSGLFRQTRYGLHGEPFEILKIRSLDEACHPMPISGALRKAGLDELPQLVNIVKGDMSIIGPRPCHRLFNIPGWENLLDPRLGEPACHSAGADGPLCHG